MLRTSICDDEAVEIEYLTACVNRWAALREAPVCISTYESAESFLFAFGQEAPPDIMLLDIQMKGMDGVALAKRLREANTDTQIIFITGFADYMSEGYEVSALHYLIKPVKEEKLFQVLDRAAVRLKEEDRVLLVPTADGPVKIKVNEILYVEAFAHYVSIQTKTGAFETRANIGMLEKEMGEGFIRCHRSYIVNLRLAKRITKTDVVLENGRAVPLSRRMYMEVNREFIAVNKRAVD
jgi:DNA-binding LytR/AlgR family response regulator